MKIIGEANSLISGAKKIGIITHKNGDGDAFGSMLALAHVLEQIGKDVILFSNEELIPQFEYLTEKIEYNPVSSYKPVDLLIGLDANTIERFSVPQVIIDAQKSKSKLLIIDHHVPSSIGDIAEVYLEDSQKSSTSEIVFDLFAQANIKIDKTAASLLLLGIELDTNSLQFTNASPQTFEVVAQLLRLGARIKPVVENAFGGKRLAELQLLGRVIERFELGKNGVGISYITKKDHQELGIEAEQSSGIVNFLERAEDVKVSAVFEDIGVGKIKGSLRSNNDVTDVQRIAKHFGGGGHVKASGYEFEGTLEEAIAAFQEYTKDIDTTK